jgi:hypothetical protein
MKGTDVYPDVISSPCPNHSSICTFSSLLSCPDRIDLPARNDDWSWLTSTTPCGPSTNEMEPDD